MEVDRAAALAGLKQHPAWQYLIDEVNETREKYMTSLAKKMMVSGEAFNDFEFKRGFLAGMVHLTRYPEGATKVLEREAAKTKKEEELEVD